MTTKGVTLRLYNETLLSLLYSSVGTFKSSRRDAVRGFTVEQLLLLIHYSILLSFLVLFFMGEAAPYVVVTSHSVVSSGVPGTDPLSHCIYSLAHIYIYIYLYLCVYSPSRSFKSCKCFSMKCFISDIDKYLCGYIFAAKVVVVGNVGGRVPLECLAPFGLKM